MDGSFQGFNGIDDETLRKILAQMQASPEDKQQAKALGLLGFGLSLAGARKGQELPALGQAGLLGINTYRNELKDLTQQRGQNLSQAMSVQDMLRRQSFAGGPQAMQPLAPQTGGPGGMDAGGPAPMRQSTNSSPINDMRNVGATDGEIRAVMSSKDPQGEFLKLMQKYREPILGQNKIPSFRGPDGSLVSVMPKGMVENVWQIAGAEQKAQEEQRAALDLIPVPVGNGQTKMMPRSEAVKFLQGQQPPTFTGLNPAQVERSMQDYTGQRPFEQSADMGGVGVTPSPIAMHAATSSIDTGAQSQRGTRAAQIQNSQTAYDDIFKQYRATREMAPHLANMAKLEAEGVFSGPAGAIGAKGANWINSLLPDANVSGAKLANTHTYESEIGKMQQAIARSFPGSQSDAELRALTSSLPSLMQTAEGRAQVRDIMTRKVADSERLYDDASKFYKSNGDLIGWKPPMFTAPAASFGTTTAAPVSRRWAYDPKTRKMVEQ